jgi:RNA polymerase sigma factor (TIGR02999 family)
LVGVESGRDFALGKGAELHSAQDPHRVTGLLRAWGGGHESALGELIPIVQAELRKLARHFMAGERDGHTLQPTALVNEAYLRLVDLQQVRWQDRAHFFAMAARLMRRILIDAARSKRYQKRGGGAGLVTFDEAVAVAPMRAVELTALDDALNVLAAQNARKAQVVELRFFGGLTVNETAEALAISPETVTRDWKLARAWLLRELGHSTERD